MAEILSGIEQQKLIKQSALRDLVTNDYLNDDKNDNLEIIADLFFGGNIDRAMKFNVGSNLFMTITDAYSFFIGSPKTDIDLKLSKYSTDLINIGKAVCGLSRVDGKLVTEYIPAKNHLYSNNEHKVFRYYEQLEGNDTKYYIYRQTYLKGSIINELFEIKGLIDRDGDKVDLDTIPQTDGLEEIIQTGLDVPSIFVADDIEALDDKNQSLIEKIKNLVYSLDRKQVMFETQFLQEVEQYKIFENIHIPDSAINLDGTVDIKSLGKVLATDSSLGATGDIKYINNTNGLIQDAIDYEQKQLKKISSSTFIPLDFLGLETNGTTSGSSRTIMISSFIKAIENKREVLMDGIIQPIIKIFIDELQVVEGTGEKVTELIYFNEVLPSNGLDTANELKLARESGIISQYSAIKTYMNFNTEKEVQEELELLSLDVNPINNDNEGSKDESADESKNDSE